VFVGNVRGDQWKEETSDDEDGKIIEDRENSYQECVYTGPNRECVYPLFNYSSLEGSLPVDPSEILKHFDAMSRDSFSLSIKSPYGDVFTVDIKVGATIKQVKQLVLEKEGYPIDQQNLIANGLKGQIELYIDQHNYFLGG